MKDLNVTELRALIKLIAPLRALREDVEKALHLEIHSGSGDLAVRSLTAIRDQIYQVTQDPYVAALTLDLDEGTKDRAKFAQVLLISGQLLAYVEAETGTAGIAGERRGHYSVQTAPNISLNMGDVMDGGMDRLMDFVNGTMREGMPRPPKPPKPPKPPRVPNVEKLKRDILRQYVDFDDEEEEDDEA
jgi:hypothetical protein